MSEKPGFSGTVHSRKHLSEGRIEVRFSTPSGELRLGRVFSFSGGTSTVKNVFSLLKSMDVKDVIFPDRLDSLENGRYCLSVPEGSISSYSGPALSVRQLITPLVAMHEKGWIHYDISPRCFVRKDGDLHLICFGEALFTHGIVEGSELAAGIPSSVYYDLALFGRSIRQGSGHLWSGDNAESVDRLCSGSISERIDAFTKISGNADNLYGHNRDSIKTGDDQSIILLHGGSWRERDRIASIYATDAIDRGWIVRFVRCSPIESQRPLPGRFPCGEACIDSGSSLISELFPSMSGVNRLLVIDQIEYASEDLAAISAGLSRSPSAGLNLLVTSSSRDSLDNFNLNRIIEVKGKQERAVEWQLDQLPPDILGKGYPLLSGNGPRYRCGEGSEVPEQMPLTTEELFREGAYKVLSGSVNRTDQDRGFAIESLLKLGRYDEVLEFTDDAYLSQRAEAHLALGNAGEAREMALESLNSDPGSKKKALLLARVLCELNEYDDAESLLLKLHGTESVLLLARILDRQGRGSEVLPLFRKAFESAENGDKVRLLCSEVNIQMRMGDYRKARDLSHEAVEMAFSLSDISLIISSLRERGRIKEVLGLWNDSLDDYRLSLSFSAEDPDLESSYALVDLFVLEVKTGDLKAAENTFNELTIYLRGKATNTDIQLISLLKAHKGALLGLGSVSLRSASKATAIASSDRMNLKHALSLLYLGQLQIQSGDSSAGFSSLNQARAEAGFMGDRHLMLLIDLASSIGGKEVDVSEIVMEAGELGLKIEKLEGELIAAEKAEEFSLLLTEMLNVPFPLKVIEITSKLGLPENKKLSNRILNTFGNISDKLEGEELTAFLDNHGYLVEELEKLSYNNMIELIRNGIEKTADWISSRSGQDLRLHDLADKLDLVSLDTEPSRKSGERKVCEDPPLYASGSDLGLIEILGPVIASVSGIRPAEIPMKQEAVELFPEIIGNSNIVVELKRKMRRISRMQIPVLITGETGTGKELVARGIHSDSSRGDRSLVSVDCGAIAENLLESELFGASKGAYTGSGLDREGLMEAANGGTLFLDEIGNLSPALQVKLLRVLETGKVRRLGETRERSIDFRIISATNSDLIVESSGGDFRSDLFFRIAVVILRIPPLRNRVEDIPLLVNHFATEAGHEQELPRFSRGALRKLSGYSWPGNIRELRNVVQRALLFHSGDMIDAGDIEFGISSMTGIHIIAETDMKTLEDCISEHVYRIVRSCDGNKTEASRILECDPKTVRKYCTLFDSHAKDPLN